MATMVGRPSVIDEAIVLKLEAAFKDGFSVSLACHLSGISRATYYKHLKENADFSDKMTLSQQWVTEQAKQVVVKAIDKGDVRAAKWWLERKAKDEFSLRYEAKVEQAPPDMPHEYLKQIAESMREAVKDSPPNDPLRQIS